jgi:hypothetical protein
MRERRRYRSHGEETLSADVRCRLRNHAKGEASPRRARWCYASTVRAVAKSAAPRFPIPELGIRSDQLDFRRVLIEGAFL